MTLTSVTKLKLRLARLEADNAMLLEACRKGARITNPTTATLGQLSMLREGIAACASAVQAIEQRRGQP